MSEEPKYKRFIQRRWKRRRLEGKTGFNPEPESIGAWRETPSTHSVVRLLFHSRSKNGCGERSGEKHNSGSHIWREILSLTLCPFRFSIKRRPTGQCSPSFSVGLIQFRAVSWTNRFLWFALQRSLLSTLLHCRATVQVTFDRPLLVLISAAATPPQRNNSKMVFRSSNTWGGCEHNCAVLSGVIRARAAEY